MITRGLDLSDESLYILNAKFPKSLDFGLTYYHLLTSPLWNLAQDLINFRLIGVVIVIASAFLLSFAVWWVTSKTQRDYWFLAIILLVAATFSITYGTLLNFSPSYNQFILFFGSIAVSSGIIRNHSWGTKFAPFLLLVNCLSLSLILIGKPSVLLPVWVLLQIYYSRPGTGILRKVAVGIAELCLVLVFAVLAYNVHLRNYLDVNQIKVGLDVLRALQNSAPQVVFANNLGVTLLQLCVVAGFLFLLLIIYYSKFWFLEKLSPDYRLPFTAALVSGLSLFWVAGSDRWISQSIFLHLSLTLLILMAVKNRVLVPNDSKLIMLLLLFPYALTVGTNNLYFSQILFYCGSWGVVTSLILKRFSSRYIQFNSVLGVVVLIFAIFLMQQFTYISRNSYGLLQPLRLNSEVVHLESIGDLRVDSETYKGIQLAISSNQSCDIQGSEVLISAGDIGGMNLILDLDPAGAAWINDPYTLNLVSRNAVNRFGHEVIWAFRASDKVLKPVFFRENKEMSLELCSEFPWGSRDYVELWRFK